MTAIITGMGLSFIRRFIPGVILSYLLFISPAWFIWQVNQFIRGSDNYAHLIPLTKFQ